MQKQFMQDLQKIYDELQSRQASLNDYYQLLTQEHQVAALIVEDFLVQMELPITAESKMAALTRVVNLREDALEQVLQKEGFSQEKIIEKKELAYVFVKEMHLIRHEYLIAWIESENLLTPFYQKLLEGIHYIGEAMSTWQSAWTAKVINGINYDLLKEYNGDEQAIFKMLKDKKLLDLAPNGEVGDRCYSVLEKDLKGEYRSVAYSEAFPNEVLDVVSAIEDLVEELSVLEDEVFEQKSEWVTYLIAIKRAFAQPQPRKLIGYWADVDRAWMRITTPLQIGHPLEYYEDHFRKAVALEWDLRIINPALQSSSSTRESIKEFSLKLANSIEGEVDKTIAKNISQIDETQLYIGQPVLYYGAEFNGLFSAQVVPNDEQVSAELGKKIFAYADFVMQGKKAKPLMQLSVDTFGIDFVQEQKTLVETKPELWQKIYDSSTIGHEFGHILWMDSDTESTMNSSGQFKNIEEFKATTGGLMAFFEKEDEAFKKHMVNDLVSRSVGLMAWREVGEVLPYYCEGLIHLSILFGSGIITYEDKIEIHYEKYDAMKKAYQEAYEALAQHYIDREDASLYLAKYTQKKEGIYLPSDEKIAKFVEGFYAQYKVLGQKVYEA
ncbi:MAG: Campylobacter invasion antigen B (CiaB) [uncultured Sulfurovum sp.]|uniref:Campylobacter invasion antigen B (CiaB) n=1 Tax=uncultured Sulfurovum sp. TaxID=269237 RepID=A0A6S6UBL7_9BACT|nr:MAG: Campylobacter invasion antigen B (CiaB) [uncultured Sulfurovum sp.]